MFRIREYIKYLIEIINLIILGIYVPFLLSNKNNKKIIFGTVPIINNKYWKESLEELNIDSETLMSTYYSCINKKIDFDKYFDDVYPKHFPNNKYLKYILLQFFVWRYILNNAKIFIMSFDGVVFKKLWRIEYLLFKIKKIRTVILPYGKDFLMYSRIRDQSAKFALLINYPNAAREEKYIENRVFYWSKNVDILVGGFGNTNGMPRTDIAIPQYIQINTNTWPSKNNYTESDGVNGKVRILHTPNHRGVKGTEYLVDAVKLLRDEGYDIELCLLENIQNDQIKYYMEKADILAEQFNLIGYGLSGIEGMASGLPVLANLSNTDYTIQFRRYSFLNECPILSTTPETLKDNLRLLITNPQLRKELGLLGRKYVEKYHSYKTAQYMFTNIFKKLNGEDVDLMNLFHPLKSEYVRNDPIKTPLVDNKYIPRHPDT